MTFHQGNIPGILSLAFGLCLASPLAGQSAPRPEPPLPIPSILVTGGSFLIGNGTGDKMEQPAHRVSLSSFWMATTPVTLLQFRQFIQSTGYVTTVEKDGGGNVLMDLMEEGQHSPNFLKFPDANWANPYYKAEQDFPVSLVSWYDAVEFCNWRSQQDGLRSVYQGEGTDVTADWTANGWRLPTEAEWEYAARGGTALEPPTRPIPPKKSNTEMSWYYDTSPRPHSVGRDASNSLGLHDLGGNVAEWCWDWYDTYSAQDQKDPTGPTEGDFRVTRAGAWFQNWYQPVMHPSNRFYEDPSGDVFCYNGFRLVRRP